MNSCRAAVERKGWLGNDEETLALSSSCCGQGEQNCFPDRQVPPTEAAEDVQHLSCFHNSQEPEVGLNPEPSTMCFLCACWVRQGNNLSWETPPDEAAWRSFRLGSQLSSSSGSG